MNEEMKRKRREKYEEIILGRILCEEAPQVVTACQGEGLGVPGGQGVGLEGCRGPRGGPA